MVTVGVWEGVSFHEKLMLLVSKGEVEALMLGSMGHKMRVDCGNNSPMCCG